jgi:hypothetical protein
MGFSLQCGGKFMVNCYFRLCRVCNAVSISHQILAAGYFFLSWPNISLEGFKLNRMHCAIKVLVHMDQRYTVYWREDLLASV